MMNKQKYISLLRGINVGGKRKILMQDLKEIFKKEGVNNVQTYIQSGNVLFEAEDIKTESFSDKIKKEIQQNYGFEVPITTIHLQILKNVAKLNPYLSEDVSIDTLHLTVLSVIPEKEKLESISSPINEDAFFIHDRFVFIKCKGKYSQSKLSNQFFEKKLGVEATTRNWKTVGKLLTLHEK